MNEFILGVLIGSALTFGITFAITGKMLLNNNRVVERSFIGPVKGVVYMAPPGVILDEPQVNRLCHLELAEQSIDLIKRLASNATVPTVITAINLISALRRMGCLNETKLEELSESEVADCFLVAVNDDKR